MNGAPARLVKQLKGRFVVLDGPDGCGKTTQRDLLAKTLNDAGGQVVSCRDPGGTRIGDRIRSVLLDFDLSTMNVACETLLFMASRAQLVHEVIAPALSAGKTVLCDRFVTSTCAYQGAAGFDPRRVVELARFAIDDSWPDWTIVLDVPVELGFSRIGRKAHHAGRNRRKSEGEQRLFDTGQPDAMEARSVEFHRRVRELYLEVQRYYPTPVCVIDATDSIEQTHHKVMEHLLHVSA